MEKGTPLQAIKYALDVVLDCSNEENAVAFLIGWLHHYVCVPETFQACNPDEPEIKAADGTVRKYVRRAAAKNGEDDIKKARWYHARLRSMVLDTAAHPNAPYTLDRLHKRLGADVQKLAENGQ